MRRWETAELTSPRDSLRMAARLSTDVGAGRRGLVVLYVVTMVAQTALQGVSLVLLVPLLSVVGVAAEGPGEASRVAQFAFDTLHLPRSLPALLALFVGLVATREGAVFASAEVSRRLLLRHAASLRSRMFRSVSRASWPFVSALRISDTQQIIQVEVAAVTAMVNALLRFVSAAFAIASMALAAVVVAPTLALPILVVAALVTFVATSLIRRSQSQGNALLWAQRGAGAVIFDNLEGVREAKSYGATERAIEQFDSYLEDAVESDLAFSRGQAAAAAVLASGAAVLLAGLAFVATEGVAGDTLTPASLIVVIFLLSRVVPSAVTCSQQLQQIANSTPALQSVMSLIERAEHTVEAPTGAHSRLDLKDSIGLELVSFRYSDDAPFVLQDFTAEFPVGSVTFVTGASGSGKTTLLDLLLGLLRPSNGRVQIDGVELSGERIGAWRNSTAVVPQHPFLFHGSVRDNLLLGRPTASDDDLWDALAAAQIAQRVREMPAQLDSTLGEGGHGLSGGERQRLALARALVRRPALLVMDEATSGLDRELEDRVIGSVVALAPPMTIVLVTHREGVAVHATNRIALEQPTDLGQSRMDPS